MSFSTQNEQIAFVNNISTTKARGQVEKWLHELEKTMKESVSNEIQKALAARSEESIIDWIHEWPGQCVINRQLILFLIVQLIRLLLPNRFIRLGCTGGVNKPNSR